MSVDELRRVYSGPTERLTPFQTPDWLLPVTAEVRVLEYLKANNCMNALVSGAVQMRYDPKQDRVVFLCLDETGAVVQATGRALRKQKPKWYKYAKVGYPFICPSGSELAVVVEDAASACAVFPVATGVALLGTYLTEEAARIIRRYPRVIIALDKDATRKAVDLATIISPFSKTRIVMLERDLKACSQEEIRAYITSPSSP